MRTFNCKTGDTKPMRVRLTYSDGSPVQLAGATATMYMGTKVLGGPCTVIDETDGVLDYPWRAGETDTAGQYPVEFEVTVGGTKARMPSKGTLTVNITKSVG